MSITRLTRLGRYIGGVLRVLHMSRVIGGQIRIEGILKRGHIIAAKRYVVDPAAHWSDFIGL
jgi:hypothetical protein